MKNINQEILKELEKGYYFSPEILNNPMRLAYYTALQRYIENLPKENEIFDISYINKYSKELITIMKTDALVASLLISELHINKSFQTDYISDYKNGTYKVTHGYRTPRNSTDPEYWSWVSKSEMSTLMYKEISSLFPSIIFAQYKTTRLKEVLKLLDLKLDKYEGK